MTEKDGVSFGRFGVIYGKEIIDHTFFKNNQISIEMALCSKDESVYSLKYIISFFNTEDRYADIVIAQWRTHVILFSRNGNYTDVNKYRKCGFRDVLPIDTTLFLSIASNKDSTIMYINGKPAKKCMKFPLIPENYINNEQLILGNFPSGNSEWKGEMYVLSVYDTFLSEGQVFNNYKKWKLKKYEEYECNPKMMYLFNERTDSLVNNRVSPDYKLLIPPLFKTLKKEMLSLPRNLFRNKRSGAQDIILNILGFVPFGFFLAIVLLKIKVYSKKQTCLLTIFSGFFISLTIEILQTFLPSRDSSLLDLVLNTAGAFIGVMMLPYTHFLMTFSRKDAKIAQGKNIILK